MSLPPEVRAKYVTIIDNILASSDLNTISEKRIRKGIQEHVEYDITPQKAAIKELIMERFDHFSADQEKASASPDGAAQPTTNGHSADDSTATKSGPEPASSPAETPSKREVEDDIDVGDASPPKKKRKPDHVDADAAFAARLQAQENLLARPTRGGNTRKAAPIKKKKKSPSKVKTAKKVRASDDSDLSGSDVAERAVNRNTGFHKPLTLSPALSALLGGETTLSRPQTVKKLWEYIKKNDLQDPKDKRQIRCDESMRAVFKQDKVHMFTMTKILNQNLYNPDE